MVQVYKSKIWECRGEKKPSDLLVSFSESSYFEMLFRGAVSIWDCSGFQCVKSRVHAAPNLPRLV